MARVSELTNDGVGLADYLYSVIYGERGDGYKGSDRVTACQILLDRYFGKVPLVDKDTTQQPMMEIILRRYAPAASVQPQDTSDTVLDAHGQAMPN